MTTDATRIRDAMADRLATLASYAGPVRKTPVPQIQPEDLPSLSVVIHRESLTPDGDANAGVPHFEAQITITVSEVRGFDDPAVLSGEADAALDAIETLLLCDPTFVRQWNDPANPPFFEGISSISRKRAFPRDGETYYHELSLDFTFQKRVAYDPGVQQDLRHIKITTRPLGHDANTPAVTLEIDVPGAGS